MSTETLDKLYLEWSKFTSARNKREGDMYHILDNVVIEGLEVFIRRCKDKDSRFAAEAILTYVKETMVKYDVR